jgi:hypothetical protein
VGCFSSHPILGVVASSLSSDEPSTLEGPPLIMQEELIDV